VWYGVAEALTNVLKHADARRVVVTLAQRDGRLVAEVGDDGRGFNATDAAGFGLAGLTDRVAALGGEFTVDSSPGEGTRVRIDLPLRETAAPAGVR
jgi:signal transduction histidine kinase